MELMTILWLFFIIVNWVNLSQSLNFYLRVKGGKWGKKIEHILGLISISLGILTLILGTIILNEEYEFYHTIGAFTYTLFSILCFIVDYWKKIEFRNPKQLKILVPFLIFYYYSLLMMTISLRELGIFPWILTSIFLFAQLGMAFYAGKHGKG
ncbi:hypothetical protein NEF87_004752 [Candidatus Lokiarchaeum ossiferum]|uniref:Uncharacterized protein n=1 Tax=Candidatus Lokiarchaeum ossiferum TaxID=2951803 RepID=A0ABY6HY60_9ARCH|nr:hypothetical protein NEF87_004752 [Candidatus Lokiarchaeum sp. B-35]